MKSILAVGALIATLTMPFLALAQTVVGRAVVDGKVALLLDDGTWNFQDAPPVSQNGCKVVVEQVLFCGQSANWSEMPPPTPQVNAAFRIDARHYAQYVIEDLGTNDGLNFDFIRTIVLGNAANFSGQESEVIDVQSVDLAGMTGETIVYRTAINGVSVVYANSIFLEPKRTMQISTYSIASEYSPEHAQMQKDLLLYTKVLP